MNETTTHHHACDFKELKFKQMEELFEEAHHLIYEHLAGYLDSACYWCKDFEEFKKANND